MQQAWDKALFEAHIEGVKNGETGEMSGKSQGGYMGAKTSNEHFQSTSVSDGNDNKPQPVGGGPGQLSGGGGTHQNTQLLLTPASIQLAQLQAQLTFHRLKLAQSAVGGNANSANVASILNQVLANVAMSQPLFNQLRASAMVSNPQAGGGGFHSSALAFQLPPPPLPPPPPPPPPNSALGTLVGAGFNQNHGNLRLNHYGGGGVSGNQQQQQQANQHGGSDYGKKASDTDRRLQYGFIGGTSVALSEAGEGQGQYVPIMTQAKSTKQGFQIDFYGQSQQQQAGFGVGNQYGQNQNAFNEQQWKSPANMSHAGKGLDMVSNAATVWMGTGQPFCAREELYNPEEPTSDPKLNSGGGGVTSSFGAGMGGTKGFVGYHKQPLQGGEETLSTGGSVQLQPHQLNDFHAVTPSHLPHQCTICEKKVYNLKDWDQHVKGKLHLQNRLLYSEGATIPAGAVHYGPAGSSEGCLNNVGVNNSMAYSSTANQDVSSGANLPAGAMRTYPMSGAGFTQLPPGSKVRQMFWLSLIKIRGYVLLLCADANTCRLQRQIVPESMAEEELNTGAQYGST
ncbi:RNA-binding protein 20-like [Salvelinus fontinalis]|uniref:RNA-binding protein 20-like n=1 Tax=Salvelinus fontinalis TaxID=8038 RepID=UPI002485CC25|nr:RNA-binding protein 20-like [Salvelinus fontinalis]